MRIRANALLKPDGHWLHYHDLILDNQGKILEITPAREMIQPDASIDGWIAPPLVNAHSRLLHSTIHQEPVLGKGLAAWEKSLINRTPHEDRIPEIIQQFANLGTGMMFDTGDQIDFPVGRHSHPWMQIQTFHDITGMDIDTDTTAGMGAKSEWYLAGHGFHWTPFDFFRQLFSYPWNNVR